jgi:hypothetical protein
MFKNGKARLAKAGSERHSLRMSQVAGRSSYRCLMYGLALAASACGGQTGSEGMLPAPPCAFGGTLVVGRIENLGGGCVSIQVERVVATGEPIYGDDGETFFDGDPAVGSTLNGHLQTMYAYTREFEKADAVAVIIGRRGNALALELLPLDDGRVQVQWGGRALEADLEEISAADCREKLPARFETIPAPVPRGSGTGGPTAPHREDPVCEPVP